MTQLAVPIAAGSIPGLIDQADRARAAGADLVELRLDTCARLGCPLEEAAGSLSCLALPAIATCRHADEGGAWDGDEALRARLLVRAAAAGARYLDAELAHWGRLAPLGLERLCGGDGPRLILSYHDFHGMGGDLSARIAAMRAAGAGVAKVAVMPQDAADLDPVRRLHDGRGPVVGIAMGEYGLPSRQLAGVWGAHLAFARLPDDEGSAPGQPDVQELLGCYRLREQRPDWRVYGVIGSPIAHSLSPLVHNAAFAQHRLPAVYARFRVEDPVAFWRACGSWIAGLSITIPHKHALLGEMDSLEQLVRQVGAMNTVWRDQDRQVGANTDTEAIVRCLEAAAATLAGRRALVLGAGGVARAIAFALRDRGAEVMIFNRTRERAEALARECGAVVVDADRALALGWEVLVNGTSVGMGRPDQTPWSYPHRPGSVVFDTVYTPLETRLLREAQAAGCTTVCGLDMFIEQAEGQFERWTGLPAPDRLMYRLALERLSG